MHRIGLSTLALAGLFITSTSGFAAAFQEDFSSTPMGHEWESFGDTGLFQWNSANQNLGATWDSSKTNSYFAHPLGYILSGDDDFSVAFDLQLSDCAAGVNPQKPNPYELSVALINLAEATGTNFIRGTGFNSPNLVEFSFFPDPGGAWIWGPSLTTMLCDWTGTNWSSGGFGPMGLATGVSYRVTLTYTAADQTLRTSVTQGSVSIGSIGDTTLGSQFRGFRVDHFAVCSYSDAGQDPSYAGSLLAHGSVDNVAVSFTSAPPPSLAGQFVAGAWQVQFQSRTNRLYTLERTSDFQTWTTVSSATPGNGASLSLQDSAPPQGNAFYRLKVDWQ